MKKKLLFVFLGFSLSLGWVRADEGKWLLMFLDKNMPQMKKEGLKLSATDIYNVNKSSLKDAIIQFGKGCTGEVISKEGLILTNHHCGYTQIQEHSTIENDYLKNGFWAYTRDQELPNPGLTARFLVRMEDVTKEVLAAVTQDMTEKQRSEKVKEVSEKIMGRAIKETHYEARVANMFDGNEYYLFVYEVYEDVRLVGAPPSSIGKFGGDIDNWMWPRQTGDFSLFRIYMSPDGKPAKYAKENVPFKPKHHLPISTKGVKQDDFAMIIGYPGTTNRFYTSFEVKTTLDVKGPSIINAREHKLNVMRKHMEADRAVAIQYASDFSQTANYWKYYIGQLKGLKRLDVLGKKEQLEKRFSDWVAASQPRTDKYGNVLNTLKETGEKYRGYEYFNTYFSECIFRGAKIINYSRLFSSLADAIQKGDDSEVKRITDALKKHTEKYFKDCNLPTDQELMAVCLEQFFRNVPIKDQPQAFLDKAFASSYNFKRMTEQLYAQTIFSDLAKVKDFSASPQLDVLLNDPVYQLQEIFFNHALTMKKEMEAINEVAVPAKRLFITGIREMDKNIALSPDANLTIRLSYGQVLNYKPNDGVVYEYYTTLDGVMQKEDPNNPEFEVPEKLKELHKNKDYGRWGSKDQLVVNFITNNDITGGNSGSPVINGKGELIGCAFDGNWEAMSGDIAFEPDLQRTICVDIRYILFIIDKYAGAKNIIDELTIVQ